jgi:hypothetical protein
VRRELKANVRPRRWAGAVQRPLKLIVRCRDTNAPCQLRGNSCGIGPAGRLPARISPSAWLRRSLLWPRLRKAPDRPTRQLHDAHGGDRTTQQWSALSAKLKAFGAAHDLDVFDTSMNPEGLRMFEVSLSTPCT